MARFQMARANEELVLAEGSLRGERAVARVRLVLMVLFGLSQSGIARWAGEFVLQDELQFWAVHLYLAFTVLALIVLQRQSPSPRRSLWMPIPTALADISFLTVMAWSAFRLTGHFNEGMCAAGNAVVLAFSVVRYSRFHILLSTLLSSGAYAFMCWVTGNFSWAGVSFVLGCYIGLGLLLLWTNATLGSIFLGLRRRDNLSRFLPRQVVDRVLEQGDTSLVPVQREVTILFSDIRDFTALSESLPPQAVLHLLDDYFRHMSQIVMAHEGMVNKFLGDGMLACWGVPDPSENHAERAMRAALDMRVKLEELNAHRVQQGEPPLRIGIGLHTGVVAAGMLGGAEQHEYTIIGDAVNVASRVEGLTKVLGVDILVSESTWRRSGGRFQGERISEERVKGRKGSVVVYSLQGRVPAPQSVFTEQARTGT